MTNRRSSPALKVVLWGLGVAFLVTLGIAVWWSIGLQSASNESEDAAERSVRENAESTLAQLRQRAEDGELTDADITEATSASQAVRAVNRTTEEVTITSELIGVSSGVFGSRGSELCVVFTFKQPIGRGTESGYRELPSCPQTRFTPTALLHRSDSARSAELAGGDQGRSGLLVVRQLTDQL